MVCRIFSKQVKGGLKMTDQNFKVTYQEYFGTKRTKPDGFHVFPIFSGKNGLSEIAESLARTLQKKY